MNTSKDEIIQVFDSIASRMSWEKLYSGQVDRISYNFITRQRAVEEMLVPLTAGKVLDLGCGSGDLVNFYVSKGARYVGVDLSRNMIERANVNYASWVQQKKAVFQVADCEALPFSDGEFDVLSAVALIEYLPDPSKALDEISRVVKIGGVALITVPNKKCFNSRIRDFFAPIRNLLFPLYLKWKKAPLAAMKRVTHYSYRQEEIDFLMNTRGFRRIGERFTNFYIIPHPADHLMPKIYMRMSECIDRGRQDQKYKDWAANYIALYRKN